MVTLKTNLENTVKIPIIPSPKGNSIFSFLLIVPNLCASAVVVFIYHYALNKHVQPRSQNPASGSTRSAGTTYSYIAHVSEQAVRKWDGQESCLEESKSRKVESLVENSLRQRATAVMAAHLVPVASVVAYFNILDRSQNKAIIDHSGGSILMGNVYMEHSRQEVPLPILF